MKQNQDGNHQMSMLIRTPITAANNADDNVDGDYFDEEDNI